MRAVIQRVTFADILIDGSEKRSISKGFLVFLGIETEDEVTEADWLVSKIASMRIFSDEAGKMNLALDDIDGEVMVVSQFTLFASTKKGNRPSFLKSAKPDQAIPLYEYFIKAIKNQIKGKVVTGEFGADMQITFNNDGPVTIIIDSKNKE